MRYKVTEKEVETAKAIAGRLQDGLDGLGKAEQQMAAANAKIQMLEAQVSAGFGSLDPTDDAALDQHGIAVARLNTLRGWVAAAQPLQSAVSELVAVLGEAGGIIEQIAQARSPAESAIASLFWRSRVEAFWSMDLANRCRHSRDIGREVARDIESLLRQRTPAILTDEERRSGFLRNGSVVLRPLTYEEMLQGCAFE